MLFYQKIVLRFALPMALSLFASAAAHACATCVVRLSSDAAMGYSTEAGWRLSVDYSFINQNQLRYGSSAVLPAQAAAINNAGGSQEVERQTINRYLNFGISYSPNANWNIAAIVPYIDRSHTTYGNATSDQLNGANVSGATSAGIGDIKLIGSYQGFLPTHNLGVQFGVKLPTGNYGGQNVLTGATVGRNPVFFPPGLMRAPARRSTPACNLAPVVPTSFSVRIITSQSARISMPSSMASFRQRLRKNWISQAAITVPET